ncbi:hypothetical protein IQ254_02480 [Nodosilinea sp. LEGE 07088]|uniref:hypothetical protein n=1 Tax=Nodosilinea sp. LEGE 07088 TaxID=2777968 RepID=UPI0018824307|nr:hypothetical protein [Nodosilinea sp. LEGE 07088]MBE9136078.1 hypothetical protein [Nodosilinea sp. LEGE 07088]
MAFKLDTLFDAPDKKYLNASDLSILSQYVSSIPERMAVYRTLRDQEVAIMQPIADVLQQQGGHPEPMVERSVRNGLMVLRYVAMAMLLDDDSFVEERLQGWLPEMIKAYDTQAIDQQLFQLLEKQLSKVFSPAQLNLLKPSLEKAQGLMLNTRETVTPTLAGLF